MKTLIVYASKIGTTEKCARILGQNLKDKSIILYMLWFYRELQSIF